jgi:NitT/TauT family transport system substrate-binding protein
MTTLANIRDTTARGIATTARGIATTARGIAALAAAATLGLAAPVAAQDLGTVKIGLLRVSSQAPFFVGYEKGYFAEAGVDAELVFFDAAVPATLAIASGDVDMAIVGLIPAFFNLAADGSIKVVSGHAREAPGFQNTGYFASQAAWDAGVRSFADIRGRSVGMTTMGSTAHFLTAMIAERNGFGVDDLSFVPAQGLGNLAAMVQGGQVDVAAGASTGFLPLLAEGSIHLIGWGGDAYPMQLSALATSARMIDERRAAIDAVISVYDRVAEEYRDALLDNRNPDGTFIDQAKADEFLAIVETYTGTPADVMARSLSFIDSRLDVGSIVAAAEWYHAEGFMDRAADPAQFLDLSFVDGHENVPDSLAAQ